MGGPLLARLADRQGLAQEFVDRFGALLHLQSRLFEDILLQRHPLVVEPHLLAQASDFAISLALLQAIVEEKCLALPADLLAPMRQEGEVVLACVERTKLPTHRHTSHQIALADDGHQAIVVDSREEKSYRAAPIFSCKRASCRAQAASWAAISDGVAFTSRIDVSR